MKIETTFIKKIAITDVPRLDPIDVHLEDIAHRQGRITIRCYSQAWTAYWGGMGDRTIAQFFCSCDEDYLANNLSSIRPTMPDYEGLYTKAKKNVLQKRRKGWELDKDGARRLFDKLDHHVEHATDVDTDAMQEIFGDEWWHEIPDAPNHEHEYLCRIINAVKVALKDIAASVAPEPAGTGFAVSDLLAPKHTGMKVSAHGLLGRIRDGRYFKELNFGCGEMLRHMEEMATRFYTGDVKVVDEFLQLYDLDEKRPASAEEPRP